MGNRRAWTPVGLVREALAEGMFVGDPDAIEVAMATVVANAEDGDPLWVLLVGPPSRGKTELVQAFEQVEWCAWMSQISENTFLSGLQRQTKSGRSRKAPEHSLLFRWTDQQL